MKNTVKLMVDGDLKQISNVMMVEEHLSSIYKEKNEYGDEFFKEIATFAKPYINKGLFIGTNEWIEADIYPRFKDYVFDKDMNVIDSYEH